jgi:hypothetical protein
MSAVKKLAGNVSERSMLQKPHLTNLASQIDDFEQFRCTQSNHPLALIPKGQNPRSLTKALRRSIDITSHTVLLFGHDRRAPLDQKDL